MARELYQLPSSGSLGNAGPGWVYYLDSQHTTASRQTITAGTRALVTIDKLGATTEESFIRTLSPNTFASNTINPDAVGEIYEVRLDLKIAPLVVADGYVELELDIGVGSEINIYSSRLLLQKGIGVTHSFGKPIPIFCLSTFNANGGKLYLRPSVDIQVWNKAIFLQRTFSP